MAFDAGRWSAHWIWDDVPDFVLDDAFPRHVPNTERRTLAFRHTFDVGSVPPDAPLRVFADSRYVLCVNGTEVARGPVRVNPRRARYDVVDIAPNLVAGPNTIAVMVTKFARANAWWIPPAYGVSQLAAGSLVLEARIGDDTVATDASWRVKVVDGWTDAGSTAGIGARSPELIDGRSLPDRWTEPGFDDTDWPTAVELNAIAIGETGDPRPPSYPIGPVAPRTTTMPPAVDRVLTDTGEIWDAGEIVAGTVVVDVEGPPGAELVVLTSEFAPDGKLSDIERNRIVYTCDGTRRTVETLDTYGLRALTAAGATVHGVTVRERLYPVTGDASFACSAPVLDQIWEVGRRSVTVNAFDAYTDCPTREQRGWTGDFVVHQMVDLTTNTDWGLALWNVEMAASPRPDGMLPMAVGGDIEHSDPTIIPDWALHWIHSLHNVYRYTGDRDSVARLLGVAEGVVRWFVPFCRDDGLPTDVFGWTIIDWAAVHTRGVSATICGLWGRALLEFAEMAAWLGDAGRASWATDTHARLAAAFELLWDPDRERYADQFVDGARGDAASQHGQAAAIVGGLAPPERHARLVDVLTDADNLMYLAFAMPGAEAVPGSEAPLAGTYLVTGHPQRWWDADRVVRAQPFFRYVVHDALAAAGRADLVAGQCTDWEVLLERCSTTWSETWYGGTVSHGWCSTPTRDLMQRVLGVTPAEPGFTTASVEPALGDLDWARGAVPTPAGLLHVDAKHGSVNVDSPIGFVCAGATYAAGRHTITL